MPILAEYALTPDVFDVSSYTSEELADSRFDLLREALFNEGIVRNLRNGGWGREFADTDRTWHRRGKELVKKLASQGRFRSFPQILSDCPTCDDEWCNEALASHYALPLEGIITTDSIAARHTESKVVASISRLARAPWWCDRGTSVRVQRKIDEYIHNLSLVFSCSNHLMFIDPYLDPTQSNYEDFKQLIQIALQRRPLPLIEIHRSIKDGNGRHAQVLDPTEWEVRFREELAPVLARGGHVEVFLWDELHDRYLISNVVGISLPYGFDTSRRQGDVTTWGRLSRVDRDDVMREFDSASHRHKLQGRFRI
jgi:hypothetical protein